MNDNPPWFYLAMVVIAFISWVFNRIQEATAERRRVKELKRRREEQEQDPYRSPQQSPPPVRRPQPQPADESGEMLRDLMEALGGAPKPAPAPAQRQAPPLPKARVVSSQPKKPAPAPGAKLSAAERAALERIQSSSAMATPPATVAVHRAGKSGAGLRKLLRSPGGMRQAVLLKEVLDTPVGLRQEDRM
ncbi:MAG: hypothetical protein KDN20_13000 [Verrucomicrobiae bacterium]|nr:hypothetical protein [Verrucomicrobiae bacterium]